MVVENFALPIVQNLRRFEIGVVVQLLLGPAQRLEQDVGIVEQIVTDNSLDRLSLFSWNFGSP